MTDAEINCALIRSSDLEFALEGVVLQSHDTLGRQIKGVTFKRDKELSRTSGPLVVSPDSLKR